MYTYITVEWPPDSIMESHLEELGLSDEEPRTLVPFCPVGDRKTPGAQCVPFWIKKNPA